MSEKKIKICGMRDPENIREIAELSPDYLGFIYYPESKRYAGDLSSSDISDLPEAVRKTGVFVNNSPGDILKICRSMNLAAVQLHGSESPENCKILKHSGLEVIKAFSIAVDTDFSMMGDYLDYCNYFLLDTAGPGYGGTGKKFDWTRLEEYDFDKPFFLSGGIAPADAEKVKQVDHPGFYGLDLNSRFEKEPGIKDEQALKGFIDKIRGE